jgi:hypothetical protein
MRRASEGATPQAISQDKPVAFAHLRLRHLLFRLDRFRFIPVCPITACLPGLSTPA